MAIGAGTGDSVSAFSRVPPSAKTDRSIVASTTSQVAAPANATRSRLIIRNLDAAIVVNVNLGAAATNGIGSLPIAPGGLLELTGTNQALNIIAVSGSPSVTIRPIRLCDRQARWRWVHGRGR
jgi:hypothetical protein